MIYALNWFVFGFMILNLVALSLSMMRHRDEPIPWFGLFIGVAIVVVCGDHLGMRF